jgi:hypothetical protein
MDYETTTYTDDNGKAHTAISVDWNDVTAFLGRAHNGGDCDDEEISEALIASGAPGWVDIAEGWVDGDVYGLIGPVMWSCDDDAYGVSSHYETVDEFLSMCRECFGEGGVPTLVYGFDSEGTEVYRDEITREIVLSR